MKGVLFGFLFSMLVIALSPLAQASGCGCSDRSGGGGISCNAGCGCVSADTYCACWCEHLKSAPINYSNQEFLKELVERKTPLARLFAKATVNCVSKLKNPVSIDMKELDASSADVYLRALCERISRASKESSK